VTIGWLPNVYTRLKGDFTNLQSQKYVFTLQGTYGWMVVQWSLCIAREIIHYIQCCHLLSGMGISIHRCHCVYQDQNVQIMIKLLLLCFSLEKPSSEVVTTKGLVIYKIDNKYSLCEYIDGDRHQEA